MKDPFARPDALRLKPIEVEGWPAPIDLVHGRLTLGRSSENDVALPAGSFPAVSSKHARVEDRGGKLWIIDLGSRNGTLVNGERVAERALGPGDILRLGPVGPRFMVTGRKALDQTVFVDPRAVGLAPEVSKADVEQLVAKGARRGLVRTLALSGALVCALALLAVEAKRAREHDVGTHGEDVAAQRKELASELAMAGDVLEQRLSAAWAKLDHSAPKNDTSRIVEELRREVATTRAELGSTRAELGSTRAQLGDALAKFDARDPWNLAEARLVGVAAVRRAVVLIESRLVLRHQETGALLHEATDGFSVRPNFEDRGELWALESTGSGFCIAADGSIVTNIHVVSMPQDNQVLLATRGLPIEPVLELNAVFSGETVRHPLTVVRVADGEVDLALARIEPFEGMPFIETFSLDVTPPPDGSDIYLLGFPLGHFALQEGERVIASTFRGILSRNVGGQMQVDAGVHPGNSGGPITDSFGRVVGVVFSVQALPDQTAVYTIGYGVPIAELGRIWPEPRGAGEALAPPPGASAGELSGKKR
ncbi:MAG: trypsin-like peptidase domain-containing protein [Planctomycetota bacterium]